MISFNTPISCAKKVEVWLPRIRTPLTTALMSCRVSSIVLRPILDWQTNRLKRQKNPSQNVKRANDDANIVAKETIQKRTEGERGDN